MAGLSTILYLTARLVLPVGWSALVALGAAAGTQIWSTASRALWSDTWGIALLGVVVWMLLADATGRRRLQPVVLASLLSWMYFVRPTNSLSIVAITIYVVLQRRDQFARYAITGALWFALFAGYAWLHFGHLLPTYFRADPMTFQYFGEALAGNLISPGRGLLVYVPTVAFVFYLLIRYRAYVLHGRLVVLSCAIIVAHWITISGFAHWHGGHGYGPRLMTGVVPWLALLAMLGLQAMLRWRDAHGTTMNRALWRTQNIIGIVLLGWSIVRERDRRALPGHLRVEFAADGRGPAARPRVGLASSPVSGALAAIGGKSPFVCLPFDARLRRLRRSASRPSGQRTFNDTNRRPSCSRIPKSRNPRRSRPPSSASPFRARKSRRSWGRASANCCPPSPPRASSRSGPFTRIISKWTRIFLISKLACRSSAPVTAAGRVQPGELPAVKIARAIYLGPYEGLGDAWCEFSEWINANGHSPAADLWECYVAGPESGTDSSKWRTELNRPLTELVAAEEYPGRTRESPTQSTRV